MSHEIKYGKDARAGMLRGAEKISKAIRVTLGPKGRNVVLGDPKGKIMHITKDGVSVANHIQLDDNIERYGAELIKQAAQSTVRMAGDGTTTSSILTYEMCSRALDAIQAGANPVEVKKGIEAAVDACIKQIRLFSSPILSNNSEAVLKVARISANGDEEIASLVAEAVAVTGGGGSVEVSLSTTGESYVSSVEGYLINNGYTSDAFANRGSTCVLENCYIVVTDYVPELMLQMEPIVRSLMVEGDKYVPKPLLWIVKSIEGEAHGFLEMNKRKQNMPFAAVMAPFGHNQFDTFKDIEAFTGATLISEHTGRSLDKASKADLGFADKVTITNSRCIITGGGHKDRKEETKANVEARLAAIKEALEQADDAKEKKALQDRYNRLTSSLATIYIGAPTVVETDEKYDRFDDAIRAAQSAVREGYSPGGGSAYNFVSDNVKMKLENEDQEKGAEIVRASLKSIIRQLVENCGQNPDEVCTGLNGKEYGFGFNAREERVENLLETGVLDPTLVLTSSLANAASAAGMFITAEAVVYPGKK